MTRWILALVALVCAAPSALSAQSIELYEEACDDGDAVACTVLGVMLETGEGAPQDLERAAEVYDRACDLGEGSGCANLGLMYENGSGVSLNLSRARVFHAMACQLDEPVGCERLAVLNGSGTTVDVTPRRGRILDVATGAPLGETVVSLFDQDASAVSDAEGYFTLPPMGAGRYLLRAERVGYEMTEGSIDFPGEMDLVVLLTPEEIDDPTVPGRIQGVVSEDGDGLENVEVRVLGQPEAVTLTNRQGRFALDGVRAGSLELEFEHIGYATRSVALVVHPDRTTDVEAELSTEAIELEPIVVAARSSFLERSGFFTRERIGWGYHFDRTDIDRQGPVTISDFLRGKVPGLSFRTTSAGVAAETRGRREVSWGFDHAGVNVLGGGGRTDGFDVAARRFNPPASAAGCQLMVYLDGVPIFTDRDVDWIPIDRVAAVEVYKGGLTTPMMFQHMLSGCGALVVWTKR